MATEYSFNISLLNLVPLEVWQTGTMTLLVGDENNATGTFNLPGYYTEPVNFGGPTNNKFSDVGLLIQGDGSTSEMDLSLTFLIQEDGFLAQATYLGGMVSILDKSAQETYPYVIQGVAGTDS